MGEGLRTKTFFNWPKNESKFYHALYLQHFRLFISDETLCDNSGCTNCTRAPWGPLCICPPGMKLSQDHKTCQGKNKIIFL